MQSREITDMKGASAISVIEVNQLPTEIDPSHAQPLQPGDTALNSGLTQSQIYNLQLLEAAYHKLPHPRDSEFSCPRRYVPRLPVVTPASYPQTKATIVDDPDFWKQLSLFPYNTEVMFFAFYFQQKTYQQYLAARELKRQQWRYHIESNLWFRQLNQSGIVNNNFERGNYEFFDFNIANDNSRTGWRRRNATDLPFDFEYGFLEDDEPVP
ncbi:CCR4-NOT transcription complex subunit 3-like isoform X1 [Zingiber officinale]|uniref:CCR4-NOT transcription complex subunit 3-like isoform X1 n=1 Tax=Zingiber officinale TaxID=94328 RepID=UPI001C4B4E14|nr:CCR4-NOT transcription complex subunit 3-like isoform X1 [Zingiber officinale]